MITYTNELVTPEMAEEFLRRNVLNRKFKIERVRVYARQIEAGGWLETAEPLKFDTDGHLLDGQNRCMAIVRAGIPVKMTIARGVEPEARVAMDSGAPRSGGDVLTMDGLPNGRNVAAAAKAHFYYTSGMVRHAMDKRHSGSVMSNSEVLDYVREHPGLEEAAKKANRIYPALRLPQGATAVAVMECEAVDPTDADLFFERLRTFEAYGHGDPIATLFRRVALMRERRERIQLPTALFLLFKTWNAYRDNQPLLKFQIGSDDRGWGIIPTPK